MPCNYKFYSLTECQVISCTNNFFHRYFRFVPLVCGMMENEKNNNKCITVCKLYLMSFRWTDRWHFFLFKAYSKLCQWANEIKVKNIKGVNYGNVDAQKGNYLLKKRSWNSDDLFYSGCCRKISSLTFAKITTRKSIFTCKQVITTLKWHINQ